MYSGWSEKGTRWGEGSLSPTRQKMPIASAMYCLYIVDHYMVDLYGRCVIIMGYYARGELCLQGALVSSPGEAEPELGFSGVGHLRTAGLRL